MHTYIVSGTIQYCIYSQWSEITINEEVRAAGEDAARQQVLDRHTALVEQQDPYATVKWFEQPQIEERNMPVTPNDLAVALRNTLEHGPTPEAHWTLTRWETQQDKPDAGRGLARLLWRNYSYAIGQLAQLSEFDRRTMAEAYVRYHQSFGAKQDLTVSMVLATWQIAIDRQVAQRSANIGG